MEQILHGHLREGRIALIGILRRLVSELKQPLTILLTHEKSQLGIVLILVVVPSSTTLRISSTIVEAMASDDLIKLLIVNHQLGILVGYKYGFEACDRRIAIHVGYTQDVLTLGLVIVVLPCRELFYRFKHATLLRFVGLDGIERRGIDEQGEGVAPVVYRYRRTGSGIRFVPRAIATTATRAEGEDPHTEGQEQMRCTLHKLI